MKKALGIMVSFFFSLGTAAGAAPQTVPSKTSDQGLAQSVKTYKPQAKPIDLTGEVVDTWCYASRSVGLGRGPEHAKCADACAHGGVTLGIVDDTGKLYIAAKSRAYSGCQKLLEPFVAKRVHVHGWVGEIGGVPILKIEKVEEVKPNAPGSASKPHK